MELTPLITENFLELSADDTLSSVAGKLQDNEKRCGLVFKNNNYLGLASKRKLLQPNVDLSQMHIDKVILRTPILEEQMTLLEAAQLFFASGADFLPFERNKEIIGVISAVDVVKAIADLPDSSKLDVNDVKLNKPSKVINSDSMATAMELMLSLEIDTLPAFNKGKLEGVVKYKDVMRRYLNWSPKRNMSGKFNRELRSKGAFVDTSSLQSIMLDSFVQDYKELIVLGKMSLSDAITTMKEQNSSELLVLDQGDYKGMLTVRNILGTLATQSGQKNFTIQFVGLGNVELTEHQRGLLDKITEREAIKLQRKINEDFTVTVHLKQIRKDGKQKEFIVNLKIEMVGNLLTSTKEDWDLETALHKCFNMLKV